MMPNNNTVSIRSFRQEICIKNNKSKKQITVISPQMWLGLINILVNKKDLLKVFLFDYVNFLTEKTADMLTFTYDNVFFVLKLNT